MDTTELIKECQQLLESCGENIEQARELAVRYLDYIRKEYKINLRYNDMVMIGKIIEINEELK